MLFSLILRSYKTYGRLTYVPVSNSNNFTAFVGENGIGKSSVIEALDTYFNKPQADWNLHHSTSKGVQEREPTICPIFFISKKNINSTTNIYKYLNVISDITWQLEFDDFNSSQHRISKEFCSHRDALIKEQSNVYNEYFLFPLGLKVTSLRPRTTIKSLSIFDAIDDYKYRLKDELDVNLEDTSEKIYSYLQQYYKYIHIPSDIDFEEYTKIESDTIQALMGTTVEDMIKSAVDTKFIKDINRQLDEFIKKTSSDLEKYTYKKPGQKQTLFNLSHLSSKIIDTYFESKILNLKTGSDTTPIYNLSSGEKRMALIDLAKAFLINTHEKTNKKIILAIDEPEISLHTSSCFEQFEKVKEISNFGVQTLITTHWYGFMPIISNGLSVYVADLDENKVCRQIDLRCFRDEFKRLRKETKGKLPREIELKGTNDLVQSIVASITSKDCNWIICEGSSDKIYLEHFLEGKKDVYILPIGKASNVKKLYSYLYLALSEERDNIIGKVFMLLDTDRMYEKYNPEGELNSIRINRLSNCLDTKITILKKTSDTAFYPPTEIEDSLIGEFF
jgi:predicted ATP-dependent endonuclease of OLD family